MSPSPAALSGWPQRRVLVTGASGVIGKAVVDHLSSLGAHVIAATHTREAPTSAKSFVRLDVTDETSVQAAFVAAGRVDTVVLCAGKGFWKPLSDTSLAEWESLVSTNLTGTFLCLREAHRRLRAVGGRIVVVGSIAGNVALAHNGAYGATKFGERGLCGILNEEAHAEQVHATWLAVGAVSSSLFENAGLKPERPLLSPQDVARAVASVGALELGVRVDELTLLPAEGILRAPPS
jgi:NAD(P)-dependent dehydrogenase (short-subunit alcohol dehydrogenase family)